MSKKYPKETFYHLIYQKISVQAFACLYSEKKSRPKPLGQYLYQLAFGSTVDELWQFGKTYYLLSGFLWRHRSLAARLCRALHRTRWTGVATPEQTTQCGCLQFPDDPDATYRYKAGLTSKSQAIHVAEICHPQNQLDFITDVVTQTNNTDNATIIEQRAKLIADKTPDIAELHADEGYGRDKPENALIVQKISLFQMAIRGPMAKAPLQPVADRGQGKMASGRCMGSASPFAQRGSNDPANAGGRWKTRNLRFAVLSRPIFMAC